MSPRRSARWPRHSRLRLGRHDTRARGDSRVHALLLRARCAGQCADVALRPGHPRRRRGLRAQSVLGHGHEHGVLRRVGPRGRAHRRTRGQGRRQRVHSTCARYARGSRRCRTCQSAGRGSCFRTRARACSSSRLLCGSWICTGSYRSYCYSTLWRRTQWRRV
jgi:hypothetical protein